MMTYGGSFDLEGKKLVHKTTAEGGARCHKGRDSPSLGSVAPSSSIGITRQGSAVVGKVRSRGNNLNARWRWRERCRKTAIPHQCLTSKFFLFSRTDVFFNCGLAEAG
jgi:hypothetical protein